MIQHRFQDMDLESTRNRSSLIVSNTDLKRGFRQEAYDQEQKEVAKISYKIQDEKYRCYFNGNLVEESQSFNRVRDKFTYLIGKYELDLMQPERNGLEDAIEKQLDNSIDEYKNLTKSVMYHRGEITRLLKEKDELAKRIKQIEKQIL